SRRRGLHTPVRPALGGWLSRAAACRRRPNVLFPNRGVAPPASARHIVEQYLSLLSPLGITAASPEFLVPVSPDADRRMEDWLVQEGIKRGDRLLAIHPGAGKLGHRAPVCGFRRPPGPSAH